MGSSLLFLRSLTHHTHTQTPHMRPLLTEKWGCLAFPLFALLSPVCLCLHCSKKNSILAKTRKGTSHSSDASVLFCDRSNSEPANLRSLGTKLHNLRTQVCCFKLSLLHVRLFCRSDICRSSVYFGASFPHASQSACVRAEDKNGNNKRNH